jgi:hypothetical protein
VIRYQPWQVKHSLVSKQCIPGLETSPWGALEQFVWLSFECIFVGWLGKRRLTVNRTRLRHLQTDSKAGITWIRIEQKNIRTLSWSSSGSWRKCNLYFIKRCEETVEEILNNAIRKSSRHQVAHKVYHPFTGVWSA